MTDKHGTNRQSDATAIESWPETVLDENSNAQNVTERLKEALKRAGGNRAVITRSGIPSRTLSNYLAGRDLKLSATVALADACGVSVEWLATGRGDRPSNWFNHKAMGQELSAAEAESTETIHGPSMPLAMPLDEDRHFVAIPRYDVRASAGGGSDIVSEPLSGYISLDEQFLRLHIGRRREDLVTIEATGESMAPTIKDGSILFVDIGTREIDDGRIYVLRVNDRLLVKRLQLRANGHVVLRSDNPAYAEEEIIPSEASPLHIIGQVVYQAGPVRS